MAPPRLSLGSDSILVLQWPFPSDLGAKCRRHIAILIFWDLRSRQPAILSEVCDYRKNQEARANARCWSGKFPGNKPVFVTLSQISETFFFLSSFHIYSVTIPPRSVDYHSGFARRRWQVCGRGGEGSRHRCLVCLSQQGSGAGHRSLGDGTKSAATGQPSGQRGARVINSPYSIVRKVQLFCPGPSLHAE